MYFIDLWVGQMETGNGFFLNDDDILELSSHCAIIPDICQILHEGGQNFLPHEKLRITNKYLFILIG